MNRPRKNEIVVYVAIAAIVFSLLVSVCTVVRINRLNEDTRLKIEQSNRLAEQAAESRREMMRTLDRIMRRK